MGVLVYRECRIIATRRGGHGGHWGIENRLHWSLNVVFHEDDSRIRNNHSPENMTLIRKIALNLLTKDSSKDSKKRKRLKAGWDNDFLIQVLLS